MRALARSAALILVTGMLLLACGNPDEDCGSGGGDRCVPDKPASTPDEPRRTTVVLQPVEVRGGSFIEGFVAAFDVDPVDRRGIDGVQYDDEQRVTVPPSPTDLRVIIYPCDGVCGTWDDLASRYDADLAAGRSPRVEPSLVRCAIVVDVDAGGEIELTPLVVVGGPDGETCSFIEGDPARVDG